MIGSYDEYNELYLKTRSRERVLSANDDAQGAVDSHAEGSHAEGSHVVDFDAVDFDAVEESPGAVQAAAGAA